MFQKILIANRGEIACRIIRTARKLGIQTVAVFSDADRHAQHVVQADEAVYLGPAPSQESYLRADKIIAAAQQTGAQAIHPGYGFLAENESFAEQIQAAGLVFIGPPTQAIAAMGSKSAAKTIMAEAGVPLVPGYHGDNQSVSFLQQEAEKIGYPVLLKAAYGGGGKGMRIVEKAADFEEALHSAQREAKAAFDNDKMLVEKYIMRPRHVEVQVFCDKQGNGLYLAERDCSVQRRHQKVIEEAPAPGLSAQTRQAMGEAAVRAAQAIQYEGAGTVEFLYDSRGEFYFMEMNTRLQVEHPITEMVLGLDLVEWQLKVAAGQPLPLQQSDIQTKGHAFEARIYAENPDDHFMPSTGTLEHLVFPPRSDLIRIDTGVIQGDEVSTYYDPMIAKLIVWGADRKEALARLQQALLKTYITGLSTNTDYLRRITEHPAFQAEKISTHFIDEYSQDLKPNTDETLQQTQQAILASCFLAQLNQQQTNHSPWSCASGWRLNEPNRVELEFVLGDEIKAFSVEKQTNHYLVLPKGQALNQVISQAIKVALYPSAAPNQYKVEINQQQQTVYFVQKGPALSLFTEQGRLDATRYQAVHEQDQTADGALTAPMNGTLVDVLVRPGDQVEANQPLVIMEAMKMEYTIRAPYAGTIEAVYFQAGELVNDGAELVSLSQTENEST